MVGKEELCNLKEVHNPALPCGHKFSLLFCLKGVQNQIGPEEGKFQILENHTQAIGSR
jgi:hypothetical protein